MLWRWGSTAGCIWCAECVVVRLRVAVKAVVGFPGWVGGVTGFSNKIALSEKVWETYDNPDVQPGHYDGEPVVMSQR